MKTKKSAAAIVTVEPAVDLVPMRGAQTRLTFSEWLKAVPPSENATGEATIPLTVTLPEEQWLNLAHLAATHGQTLEEAVTQLLFDASLSDQVMNYRKHLFDPEERDFKATIGIPAQSGVQ